MSRPKDNNNKYDMKFEVLTAVIMSELVLCVVKPCLLVGT
jgi:hypothetical protein